MKILLLGLALFLSLNLVAREPQGPCAEDVKTFCKDIAPGGGAVHECMKKNEAQLSPACKEHMAKVAEKISKLQSQFGETKEACKGDVDKFCSGVGVGKGQKIKCLKENMGKPDFSAACKSEIEKLKEVRKSR